MKLYEEKNQDMINPGEGEGIEEGKKHAHAHICREDETSDPERRKKEEEKRRFQASHQCDAISPPPIFALTSTIIDKPTEVLTFPLLLSEIDPPKTDQRQGENGSFPPQTW